MPPSAWSNISIRQGLYKDRAGPPQPPYLPGLEAAGIIRALGDGVEGFHVAEPVVTLSGTGAEGGYASVTVADAAMTVSLDGTGIGPRQPWPPCPTPRPRTRH
jgi:NADPH2:quinone reductase